MQHALRPTLPLLCICIMLMTIGLGNTQAQLPPHAPYTVSTDCSHSRTGVFSIELKGDTTPMAMLYAPYKGQTYLLERSVEITTTYYLVAQDSFNVCVDDPDTIINRHESSSIKIESYSGHAYAEANMMMAVWSHNVPLALCITDFVPPADGSLEAGYHEGEFWGMVPKPGSFFRIFQSDKQLAFGMFPYEMALNDTTFYKGEVLIQSIGELYKADFRNSEDKTVLVAFGIRVDGQRVMWAWRYDSPATPWGQATVLCRCSTGSIGNAACHCALANGSQGCDEMWMPGTY